MAYTQRPNITQQTKKPEEKFRKAIVGEIRRMLEEKKNVGEIKNFIVLENFGLDIAVFIEKPDTSRLCLFELKAFNGNRQGG